MVSSSFSCIHDGSGDPHLPAVMPERVGNCGKKFGIDHEWPDNEVGLFHPDDPSLDRGGHRLGPIHNSELGEDLPEMLFGTAFGKS